jgi:hypothetical protein
MSSERLVVRTRRSTDATLRALRADGHLGDVDAAQVAMLRTLADLIDAELREPEANVWAVVRLAGEWRALLTQLLERATLHDDQLSAFFFGEEARPGPV